MNNTDKDKKGERDSHFAKRRRAYRDAKAARVKTAPTDSVLLYGLHTVRAAIQNPKRSIKRMLVTRNALTRLDIGDADALPFPVETVAPAVLDKMLSGDAIHQGVVVEAKPLKARRISDLGDSPLVLVLDQVTDPHNVGAIMRSAVAMGAGALITTMRHSPQESGVLAKSASGALELIPHIQVVNLAEAIEELNGSGFLTIGLDSEGDEQLEATFGGDRIALVLGAEGKGLRQKTRQTVERLARLDVPGVIKSLNVSNAAAVSLYAAHRYLEQNQAYGT
ncbi:TrmH family RNA methyltransferase [Hoeflea prorocentri]|uniref:RNA methyltransferase n=1 Tax=Hoeflea prorocentri TaxID=1922333 RepID=A0A9X3UGJ1_9HYPH|nr:RNA methyltransferase [Hoeflea prorocentri]MCY6380882.1 RNA methyltransferase [Hoeflea prorocentri]MDA5398682.1 RNA methyltransferase [Hoeflea prorocentri]